jgi:HEAT repeat protein
MRRAITALGLVAASTAFFCAGDVRAGDGATPAQVADLVDELRDPDAHVREVARRQLVALGDKAVAPLIELLQSGEPAGRLDAVQVLAALGPVAKDAAPAVAERATRELGAARLPFLKALAEIDPAGSAPTAIPILLAFLDDKDAALRLEAAKALGAFGPSAAKFAPDVLERIRSSDAAVRGALLEAVRAMGVNAAEVVVDLYAKSGDTSASWLPAVVNELGEAVVAPAVKRLSSDDKAVRASAAQVLGLAGAAARGAAPQLVAALDDPAGVVRRRAAEALGAIGADARVALPALERLLADETARAQVEAAVAMSRVAVSAAHPGDSTAPFTATVGRAVEDGIDWLARHQSAGDSAGWSGAGFRDRCPKEPKDAACGGAGDNGYDIGLTGLSTMAFVGAGETHVAGGHRQNVQRSLGFLRSVQDSDGCFGQRRNQHWMYNHALATIAVTEAYGQSQSHFLRDPASRGIQFVQRAQNPYLAWRYSFPPDGDNDTSATGWAVRALAAGKRAGLDVDASSLRGALAWIDKMTEPEFGRTGYQQRGGPPARTNEVLTKFPAEKSESLTAEALCIRLDCGQDPKSWSGLRLSADLVAQKPPVWSADGSIDFYYWFHGTDAMRRLGGAAWESWRNSLVAALVPHQERSSAGCARGSWSPEDPWGPEGGRIYSTSMSVLTLEMCGSQEKRPAMTPEVRGAVAALTKALESNDEAVVKAAQAAIDDIRAAYR